MRIYGFIVLLSNVVAVLVPSVVSIPVLDIENTRKWSAFLDETKIVNFAMLIAFIVPTFVCIVYSHKIFRTEEKIVKNIAEIPSVYSLSSVIGWNLYYI